MPIEPGDVTVNSRNEAVHRKVPGPVASALLSTRHLKWATGEAPLILRYDAFEPGVAACDASHTAGPHVIGRH